MRIAIIATGDEIVHGDTLNTNAYHIAQILQSEGLSPTIHLACCDSEQQIVDCLNWVAPAHSLIILIGGLGPTSDDRTRFALATFLKKPLLEYQEAITHIETRFQQTDIVLNEGNRQQALFPQDTTLLPNPKGSAMGGYCEVNNTRLVLLPGPPRECLPMFNHHVLPLLQTMHRVNKQLLKWRLFGVAESVMGEILDKALEDLDCETGYRLEIPYVEFKVRCKPELISLVKQRIDPLVAPHIIATTEQRASEKLRQWFVESKQTISIIDEATGGILQTLLQRPENHAFIHFHEYATADLHIHITGLDAYWTQESHASTVELTIQINYLGKTHQEKHILPYRSALVIQYAAEWVSFRLFACIQLMMNKGS